MPTHVNSMLIRNFFYFPLEKNIWQVGRFPFHTKLPCRYAVKSCHITFTYEITLLYPHSQGEGGILFYYTPTPQRGRGVYCFTSVRPSVQDIFRRIFLSNCWWQKSDIWSQASYKYTILWVAFLDPSDSYFLFADLVGFYTYWTYMHIFRHIFLSNYWWQKSDIWSQASYRYPISW
jgi:hypothetical protein